MPVRKLVLTFASWPNELRRLPVREAEAVHRGLLQTARMDCDRWIQWSIRGGGILPPPPPPPPKPKNPRKKKEEKAAAPKLSPMRKLLAKLRSLLGGKKVVAPPPPAQKKAKKARSKKPKPERPHDSELPFDVPPGYRPPIDTGDYARSWRVQSTENSILFFSEANPPVKAGVIEEGRRPAPIPIKPLAEWVRRKLGENDEKKAKAIAFAISTNAAKQRRQGLNVLGRAHPKIAEAAARNVLRELQQAMPGT